MNQPGSPGCYNRGEGTFMTERIEIDPSVMLSKPVIRNTRIPVELVLRKLAEGAARGRSPRRLSEAY